MTNPFLETAQLTASKITTVQTTAEDALAQAELMKSQAEQLRADAMSKADVLTDAAEAKIAQAENAAKAAEAMALNKINEARGKVEGIISAIQKPQLPQIPKLPAIPSIPQLPQIPQIPPIPNLEFSVPSPASILKKLLPKVKLPSFKFGIEIPKFHMPRPDWKGPAKIQPPKLPPGIG